MLFKLHNALNESRFSIIMLFRKALWPGLIGWPMYLLAKTFGAL